MSDALGVLSFFVLGLIVGLAIMGSCAGATQVEIDRCNKLCSANGGTTLVYASGDCLCNNDAQFDKDSTND